MEATLTVVNIEKQYVQADQEEQLSVTVEIELREGKDVETMTRVLGFQKDMPSDDIMAELAKYKQAILAERDQMKVQMIRDEQDKQADATIAALQGETL